MVRWNVACAHRWQHGGGLYIAGTATLTNTNVYENHADRVRLPFERSLNYLSSSAPLELTPSFFLAGWWHRRLP